MNKSVSDELDAEIKIMGRAIERIIYTEGSSAKSLALEHIITKLIDEVYETSDTNEYIKSSEFANAIGTLEKVKINLILHEQRNKKSET